MQPPLVRLNLPFVAFRVSFFVPALIGELSFAVWLTVKGVNVARWQEKAGHSTASLRKQHGGLPSR
jgi:hypothetical protein